MQRSLPSRPRRPRLPANCRRYARRGRHSTCRDYSRSLLKSSQVSAELKMGAAANANSLFGSLAALDPMMGQLEVIEPGIAMFHGFANVAFAYGGGEMLAADTSSAAMGANAVHAHSEVTV